MLDLNKSYNIDCLDGLKEVEDNSVDLIATDPPYAISFMSKTWDKSLVSVETWQECLRVLKPGAFAFIMSAPRQDVLSRMIINIEDAGFKTDFTSIYWTYASGFPKAGNISKMVDKKFGLEREVIGIKPGHEGFANRKTKGHIDFKDSTEGFDRPWMHDDEARKRYHQLTAPASPKAKVLDGAYAGFQPKPAVEVVIVAMKPLEEKGYVEQALVNGKGITWLNNARIPFDKYDKDEYMPNRVGYKDGIEHEQVSPEGKSSITYGNRDTSGNVFNQEGRFPANLLVCDDVLNDGVKRKGGGSIVSPPSGRYSGITYNGGVATKADERPFSGYDDEGSASRYFDLDAWWEERIKSIDPKVLETFPFLLVPKASVSEKNAGLDDIEPQYMDQSRKVGSPGGTNPRNRGAQNPRKNPHPTVKPVKLFTYLITLGSRKGDIILDPFGGSGTTGVAAELLERNYILFEMEQDFHILACKRIEFQQAITKKENVTPLSNIFKRKL